MSQQAHQQLLQVADKAYPQLNAALASLGPVEMTLRPKLHFPDYLCRSVAGQQLSIKAASTIWSRVEAQCSEQPLIPFLHQTDLEILRGCGLSAAKCKTVKGIAEAASKGALNAQELAELDTADRTARLMALWGVGQWTADMMNIFYFAEPDIWPDNDVTVKNTLLKLTESAEPTAKIAAEFAPYRSYLAISMYEVADALPG